MFPVHHTSRRRFLALLAGAVTLGAAPRALAGALLLNPCRSPLAPQLHKSPWLKNIWSGLDPSQVWDSHVHLAGIGDSDSGIALGPELHSGIHPHQRGELQFYLNGSCVDRTPGRVDRSYVHRLHQLASALPAGCKVLLFAFDRFHDETGRPLAEHQTLAVPNDYASSLAAAYPDRFEWVASIHPYRPDHLDALQEALARGARAVKWLPSAMGMDPASPRCDRFYTALAAADLPLIVHCGKEQAIKGEERQHLNNPLRLRRALDAGVRVVVAHCASIGEDIDLDRGQSGPKRSSFSLFGRMMEEPRSHRLLHGDLSAIVLRNRPASVIKTLLTRTDWHPRLLYGSDYPLPGILPLISPADLALSGLLPKAAVRDLELARLHNPLLFSLALMRLLRWHDHSFAASIFHTRPFFHRTSL